MNTEDKNENESKLAEPDKSNPYQMYCWEFQQSIIEFSRDRIDNGNWFGRVIAFRSQFKITNGNLYDDLNREQFTNLIMSGNTAISRMETDFPNVRFVADDSENDSENKCEFKTGKIYSVALIVGRINGKQLNGKYEVVYEVKPAFQAKITNFDKLSS